MERKNRVIMGAFLALALAATAGWVAMGYAGSGGGCGTKAVAASGSGCPSAKAGGCPSAKAGGCPSAAKSACGAKGAQAAGPGCGTAMAGGMGDLVMPDGTKMTRMDVDNGIDLIFTGKDLAAIRARLEGHIAACTGMKEKPCAAQTCAVASTENSVVLSVRGPNAESCCTMMTASLSGDAAKAEPVKPAKKKGSWWKRT
jgi:hypothetical protein